MLCLKIINHFVVFEITRSNGLTIVSNWDIESKMSLSQFVFNDNVTLGSILDFQQSWKSSKFQLARWGHIVDCGIILMKPPTTHPPTAHLFWQILSDLRNKNLACNLNLQYQEDPRCLRYSSWTKWSNSNNFELNHYSLTKIFSDS